MMTFPTYGKVIKANFQPPPTSIYSHPLPLPASICLEKSVGGGGSPTKSNSSAPGPIELDAAAFGGEVSPIRSWVVSDKKAGEAGWIWKPGLKTYKNSGFSHLD